MLTFLLLLYVGLGVAHGVAYKNLARRLIGENFIKTGIRTQTYAFLIGVLSYIDFLKECSRFYTGSLGVIKFRNDKSTWILYRLNYAFLPLSIVYAIVFAPVAYLAKAVYLLKRRKQLAA